MRNPSDRSQRRVGRAERTDGADAPAETTAGRARSRTAGSSQAMGLPPPRPLPEGAPSSEEAAGYIMEMSLTLRNLANDTGLEFLAYLLDMAAEEADMRARDVKGGRTTARASRLAPGARAAQAPRRA